MTGVIDIERKSEKYRYGGKQKYVQNARQQVVDKTSRVVDGVKMREYFRMQMPGKKIAVIQRDEYDGAGKRGDCIIDSGI